MKHPFARASMLLLLTLSIFILHAPSAGLAAPRPAGPVADTAACSSGIAGTVIASDTNAPLEFVTVTVSFVGGDFVRSAETDPDGHYTIAGLPAGKYQVQFEPDPSDRITYLSEYYADRSSAAAANLVQVATGAIASGIDAALDVGGTISGVVIGADTSSGLNDVLVNVYTSAGEPIGETFTNTSGAYTTDALPSGSYKIEFVPPDGGKPYLSEFFNNKPSLVTAAAVAVAAPNDTLNVDATLDLGGQIRGIVTAVNSGANLAGVAVVVYSSDGQFVDSTFTDAAGNYATAGLRAGSYKLRFVPSATSSANAYLEEYYNRKPDRDAADLVAVSVPNTTTIDAALTKGGQFTGQVTAAGAGTPLADVNVQVYSADGQFVTSTTTDASGNYLTPGVTTGDYKLLFAPSGLASAAIYAYEYNNNKPTLALADLVASPPATAPGRIDAALEAGGRISGNVSLEGADLCGNAFDSQDAQITVYDSGGQPVATTQPDTAGDYITPALPAGSYRVGFDGPVDAGFVQVYYNGKPTLASADLVGVTVPNTTPNINARLTRMRKLYLALIGA